MARELVWGYRQIIQRALTVQCYTNSKFRSRLRSVIRTRQNLRARTASPHHDTPGQRQVDNTGNGLADDRTVSFPSPSSRVLTGVHLKHDRADALHLWRWPCPNTALHVLDRLRQDAPTMLCAILSNRIR